MLVTCIPSDRSDSEPVAGQPPRRRGATVMEYVMMLSLIVTVAMVGIGYFGGQTGLLTKSNTDALSKSLKKGS